VSGSVDGIPNREIRAAQTAEDLVVYQAFGHAIADAVLAAQRFVAPFKMDRMTWIKPSLCWMMYRSGWASKPGQERVLAVTLARSGFEWALCHACLSHFDAGVHGTREQWQESIRVSPVRIQWDPERSVALEPLAFRTIQVGLSGKAVERYVSEWIRSVRDVTGLVQEIRDRVEAGDIEGAERMRPVERLYPIGADVARRIGAHESSRAG